ncbi:MAG: hypothetical protein ISS19_18975, partial [Bacteroidales bacterium]|nr:hypothetical protein [Bacteroidales bacterium]
MFRILNSIFILLLFSCLLSAQDVPDFRQVDIETYRFYEAGQWDSLIELGEPALDNGIDYFYLRMRLGIARYEKRNYIKSSQHFRHALEFNNVDPVALEYLYYAYLLSGKVNQANFVAKQFPESLKQKTGIIPKPVDKVDASFFYSRSATDDIVNNSIDYFPTDVLGYQVVTKYFSNFNISLRHYFGSRFSLNHAYTHLYKVNFNYLNNGTYIIKNPDIVVKQHQYYISINSAFAGGWNLAPAFHIVHTRYPVITSITQGGPGRPPSTQYTGQKETSLLAGLMVTKSLGYIDLRLYGHGSNLNNNKQAQGAVGLTWYPFGNLDLYVGGDFIVLLQPQDRASGVNPIGNGMVGFSIARKVWFEFTTAVGEMQNYAEGNGYLVYNSADILSQKYNLNISVLVTDRGSLIFAGARYSSYASYLTSLIDPELTELNELNYNNLSIYGG